MAEAADVVVRTSTRASARDTLRQHWQERRREVSMQRVASLTTATARPSVCHIVKETWLHLWNELVKEYNKTKPSPRLNGNQSKSQPQNKPRTTSSAAKKGSFPSVVAILHQSEVHRQVQTLQEEDALKEVLSVLPTSYDWTKAIQATALRRNRAFWLLDVSVILRNVSKLKRPRIRYVYDVHHSTNSDPVLLKILTRSKVVSLATTTKWDLDRCRAALDQNVVASSSTALLLDSAATCGKPDGYIREWIRCPNHGPLVIDGASELRRICATVQRLRERSGGMEAGKLKFSLRFKEASDISDWKQTIHDTFGAMDVNNCSLVGMSFHVPETPIKGFCNSVEAFLDHVMEASSPIFTSHVDIDLRGHSARFETTETDLGALLDKLAARPDIGVVTVDATKLLLSSAGALCTRVIGVREQQLEGNATRRHYYIDDGCYGSLCVKDNSLMPLPLFPPDPPSATSDTCIWGPTCDGLDRVCQGIQLPVMQRDDWLVFAGMNSGSEGLSTAFNGFDPPDTAYCVLGYFGKQTGAPHWLQQTTQE